MKASCKSLLVIIFLGNLRSVVSQSTCNAGYYTENGQKKDCTPCASGYYQDVGALNTACKSCDAGKVAPAAQQTSCTGCLAGTYQNLEAQLICKSCEQGYYEPDPSSSACNECAAGKANAALGSTGSISCVNCVAGKSSTAHSASCTDCVPGRYENVGGAPAGTIACKACGIGKFSVATARTTDCDLCPIANYQDTPAQTTCKGCLSGTYQDEITGTAACINCPGGWYQNSGTQSVCKSCISGLFASAKASTCTECVSGQYNDQETQQTCTQCVGGQYQNTAGLETCKNCPVGKYVLAAGSESSAACNNCLAGFFNDIPGQSSCKKCLPGQYQDTDLDAGNTVCKNCVAGQYRGANTADDGLTTDQINVATELLKSCLGCDEGKFQDQPGSQTCQTCLGGTYQDSPGTNVLCKTCLAGWYQDQTGQTACKECAVGQFRIATVSVNGVSTAAQIQLGLSCTPCGIGRYAGTKHLSVCNACQEGQYQEQTGTSTCKDCLTGQYQDQNLFGPVIGCKDCGAGMFSLEPKKASCDNCAGGQFRVGGACSGASACACTECPVGQIQSAGGSNACVECAGAKYQDQTGKTACKACKFGQYSGDPELCTDSDCNILEGTTCSVCPAGWVVPVDFGRYECEICKVGFFHNPSYKTGGYWIDPEGRDCGECESSITEGALTCVGCQAGEYGGHAESIGENCWNCPVGWYAGAGNKLACERCPIGFHGNNVGSPDANQPTLSTDAPATWTFTLNTVVATTKMLGVIVTQGSASGTLAVALGPESTSIVITSTQLEGSDFDVDTTLVVDSVDSVSFDSTTMVEASQFLEWKPSLCSTCEKGTYNPSEAVPTSTGCIECDAGYYGDQTARVSNLDCKECPEGRFQKIAGAAHEATCYSCPAGYYSSEPARKTDCVICKSGAFMPDPASITECQECPFGFSQRDRGQVSCDICLPGRAQVSSGQPDCPVCIPGKFTEELNATQCEDCPRGKHQSKTASASCLPCIQGRSATSPSQTSCTECLPGYFMPNSESNITCFNCPSGWMQEAHASSSCKQCLVGTYQLYATKSACELCPKGYVQDTTAQKRCNICPAGFSQKDPQQTVCNPCRSGKYQKDSGQFSCKKCPTGYVQPDTGTESCVECGAGKVQNDEAQSSCITCAAGTYQKESGQTLCKNCPSGYVQPATAKDMCTMCLAGSTQQDPAETVCVTCPAGRVQPNNASSDECIPCSLHFYSPVAGRRKCVPCALGFQLTTTGGSECIVCSAGKYGLDTRDGVAPACTSCQEGTFRSGVGVENDDYSCTSCPAGFRQPNTGSVFCLPCIPGRFNIQPELTACDACDSNYFASEINQTSCQRCKAGEYTNNREASPNCQPCPAGKAGAGCVPCSKGTYRGNTDPATACLQCDPGLATADEGQPFCLDCDAGKFATSSGQIECIDCPSGYHAKEKKTGDTPTDGSCTPSASNFFDCQSKCTMCLNDLVPNAQKTTCMIVPIDPYAALVTLTSIEVASKDARSLRLTVKLSKNANALQAAEENIRNSWTTVVLQNSKLEVRTYSTKEFTEEFMYRPQFFDVPATEIGVEESTLSFVIQPPPEGSRRKEKTGFKLETWGSAWVNVLFFQIRIVIADKKRGEFSSSNDAYKIAKQCLDIGYLRTHPDDQLSGSPLPLMMLDASLSGGNTRVTDAVGDTDADALAVVATTPECRPCPEGANCKGDRTFAQVVAKNGSRVLPWDPRGYGACPRSRACFGNDDDMEAALLPPLEQDGGNSTQIVIPCHVGHQSIMCGECAPYYDTAMGDTMGLCGECPEFSINILRVAGLVVAAVGMLAFLVLDSMGGIQEITKGVEEKEDVSVPFHSVGIRIMSSFMQVTGLLGNFQLELPPAVVGLITVQSSVSGVGGAIVSFNCLLPTVRGAELFLIKILFIIVILPIAMAILVGLFWSLYGTLCHKVTENGVQAKDKFLGSMIVLFYLLFPSILNGMTEALACTTYGSKVEKRSKVLLDGALSVECYKTEHIALLLTVVLPSFIVFVLLIPTAIVKSMSSHYADETLLPHQANFHPMACYRFGFLFLGYEQEWYGWEVLVMLRKAAFVVVTGLLRPYGPTSQVVGASTILIASLSVHLQHRPYDSDGHDSMESVSLHASLTILMCALFCSLVGKNEDGSLGPISTVLLIVMVFGATLIFFFVSMRNILNHSHKAKGVIGKLARFLTKASHNDRRHSLAHGGDRGHLQKGVMSRNLLQITPVSIETLVLKREETVATNLKRSESPKRSDSSKRKQAKLLPSLVRTWEVEGEKDSDEDQISANAKLLEEQETTKRRQQSRRASNVSSNTHAII